MKTSDIVSYKGHRYRMHKPLGNDRVRLESIPHDPWQEPHYVDVPRSELCEATPGGEAELVEGGAPQAC